MNINFKNRIRIGFLSILVIFLFFGVSQIIILSKISKNTKLLYKHPIEVRKIIKDITIELYKRSHHLSDISYCNNENQIDSLDLLIKQCDSEVEIKYMNLFRLYLGDISDVQKEYSEYVYWKSQTIRIIKSARENKKDSIEILLRNYEVKYIHMLSSNLKNINKFAENKTEELVNSTYLIEKETILMSIIFFILLTLLIIFIARYTSKRILNPITGFIQQTKDIFSIQASERKFNTEEELFNFTIKQLDESYNNIQQQNEEITAQNEEIRAHNEEFQILNDTLLSVNDEILISEEKYRTLFEDAGDYIFVLKLDNDLGPVISEVNSKAAEKHGYTKEEMVGMPVFRIETEKFRETLDERAKMISKPGDFAIFETEHIKKDGSVFPVEVSVRMIQIGDDAPFLISIERDISERKIAEEKIKQQNIELKKLNLTKDKFFSIISHDLRNPFNSLIGFSRLLVNNYRTLDDQKKEKFINAIYKTSVNTFTLLDELLTWARSQSGELELKYEKLNLTDLTSGIVDLLEESGKSKQITINNNIIENLYIFADNNMTQTVLRNFITNSLKFTQEGGTISINYLIIEKFVKIIISDSGIGMDKIKLNSLFKISESKSTKGTNGETGTGLGLILCKEFVEKQGGTVHVESEVGKGSKFMFTIPLYMENN